MVYDYSGQSCVNFGRPPEVPKDLAIAMSFWAPLKNATWAQGRGSGTPTYSGGAVTGTGAVYYADDPAGTGLLKATTSGAPVFTSNGYQALGAISNVLTYSNTFDNAAWTGHQGTANVTGPDGVANSAWTLTDADAGTVVGVSQSAVCVNDSTSWTGVAWFAKTSGASSFPALKLDYSGGTGLSCGLTVNTDTGVITNRAASAPASSSIASVGNYWRVSITNANNSTGNTTVTFFIYIAVNTTGNGTWAAATTGSCVCYGASLWNGAFAYPGAIVTAAVAGSRSADVLTYPAAGNIAAADGFVACRASGIATAANSYAIGVAASGRTALYLRANNHPAIYDGTERVGTQTWANNTLVGVATSWNVGAATSRVALNGVVQSFAWTGFTPSSIAAGDGVGGGAPLWGTVANLRIGRDVGANDVARLSVQP